MRPMQWTGLAAVVMLSACATPGDGRSDATPAAPTAAPRTVPSYLTTDKGCAVVAGGGIGSLFADPKIGGFWQQVNGEITSQLHDRLVEDHYRVVKLVVSAADAPNNEAVVVRALAANRCNRLIQVSHKVDEDANGKYFRFDVAAMRLRPDGANAAAPGGTTPVTTVGEFKREYRFARTAAMFSSFHTGQFAGTVLQDLKQSGALEPLR